MLVQATQAHELLTELFWKAHLRKEGKILFLLDHDAFDSAEDDLYNLSISLSI